MSETNETLEVLKLLVEKIQKLEETVYHNDNVLMKAGLVKVDSPTPSMIGGGDGIIPDSKSIAKMSWDDINKYVSRMEGN